MADDHATDWAVLVSLLADDRGPWSIGEVAREIGDGTAAIESLERLRRAGRIHCCNEFVFPSRPARAFETLRA